MDLGYISTIAVTTLTLLSPYIIKAGEAVAEEIGKEVYSQAKNLYLLISKKFEQIGDMSSKNSLEMLEKATDDEKELLATKITNLAEKDTEFLKSLKSQVDEINILLFECLKKKFLSRDLREVYFRLGIGWDDLVGEQAGRDSKAIALIEYVASRGNIPELILAMWKVHPSLKC